MAELSLTPPVDLGPLRRADYFRLPDEPRQELIYGRLCVSPRPSLRPQVVSMLLARWLDDLAQATGGLAVAAPVDVSLGDHSVVQPDVVYVAPERRSILRERIEGAPSLVIEILSPGSVRKDRGEKLKLYAESGVDEYWLVDVAERQIEFLVLRSGAFVVTLPVGTTYRSPVLASVTLDLEAFWAAAVARLGAITPT